MKDSLSFMVTAANVQGLGDDARASGFFLRLFGVAATDLALMSEVTCRSATQLATWRATLDGLGLDGIFGVHNRTGIVYRRSFISHPPSSINVLAASMPEQMRGRITDAVLTIDGSETLIVSVYAPVDNSTDGLRRSEFLTALLTALDGYRMPDGGLLIAGDWNCVRNPSLDSSLGPRPRPDDGAAELDAIVEHFGLEDTYRRIYPLGDQTTNVPSKDTSAARRLDVIFASTPLSSRLRRVGFLARVGSTHTPVTSTFYSGNAINLGCPDWKLNIEVLQDANLVDFVSRHLSSFINDQLSDQLSDRERWDEIKRFWRELLIDVSALRSRMERQEEDAIARGMAKRARLPPAQYTSISLRHRVQQVREAAIIRSIREDEVELTDVNDLLDSAYLHFSSIFDERPVTKAAQDGLLKDIDKRLTSGRRSELEKPLNRKLLDRAVRKVADGKAPGEDGLPIEAYRAFWSLLSPHLLHALREGEEEGELSRSQRRVKISPLHKSGPRDEWDRYRPLALMNVDTRIHSQTLVLRLAPVISQVVGKNQFGFIPDRLIDDPIAVVQELFESPTATGWFVQADFEKAYDFVQRRWLYAVLDQFGFGSNFINAVRASVSEFRANVMVNNWRTRSFEMASGVQQGSPVAPLLFALAIEPLAIQLRRGLQGIKLREITVRELLFADDLVAGLRDPSDISYFFNAVRQYERASGSKLSAPKTSVQQVGQHKLPSELGEAAAAARAGVRFERSTFRYLGPDCGYGVDRNGIWTRLIEAVRLRLARIPMSDLPIHERCSIINVYVLSKVWYMDKFIPASKEHIEALNRLVMGKIFPGDHKVSMDRLTQRLEHGGFGLLDIAAQFIGHRAEHVRRLAFSKTASDATIERRAVIQHAVREVGAIAMIELGPRDLDWIGEATQAGARRLIRQRDLSYRLWTWGIVLALKDPELREDARSQIAALREVCAGRWWEYIEAWHKETQLKFARRVEAATADSETIVNFEHPLKLTKEDFTIDCLGESSLKHGSRRQSARKGPIIPREDRSATQWLRLWASFRRIRRRRPKDVERLHLLALHSLQSADKGGRFDWDPERPWAASRACALCDLPNETMNHLFNQWCPIVQEIWAAMDLGRPLPSREELDRPPETGKISDSQQLQNAAFVNAVWTTRNRLRFGYSEPVPPDPIAIGHRAAVRSTRQDVAEEDEA